MSAKEAKARIKINKLLEDAGWRFFDNEFGPANIQVEANVKLSKTQIDALGDNFEKTKNGFVDFLLLDENGKPFIVLEAKSEDYDPLAGKEQARKYAKSQFVKYVILSNGNIHYFWNIYKGSPQVIITFPTYESVKESKALNADPAKLYSEEIAEDYIAVVKEPRYAEAPEYQNEETRAQFLRDRGLRMLRKDQVNALKALQASVREGNQRFLFEMATGTGKTLTSAAVIRLFLRSGNANRVLFLVDRIELENQAKKNFISYLKPDYETVIFKEHTDDWRKADIVVSTVQTLSYNNKFKKVFKPTDFSLIIADESHRSISGNSRAVFEYFIGYKLGLTATPKDYLKNVDADDLIASDPRAWERRQLLDTYKTFGCESGEPNLRIYPEFYFRDLAYFADLAIVQVDPDSEEEYLANAVTDIIAIIELKYTAGTADRTATWVKKDVAKMKDYIQTGKLSCQFYFAVIYEVECSSLRWMDRRSTNNWASGYVTELDAGYINDEMRFEVNAYNGMNEDIK